MAFEREVQRFTAEGYRSAGAMGRRGWDRAFFLHMAPQPLSAAILEGIREMVRAELAHQEQERLGATGDRS
jgi:hypothetical protein